MIWNCPYCGERLESIGQKKGAPFFQCRGKCHREGSIFQFTERELCELEEARSEGGATMKVFKITVDSDQEFWIGLTREAVKQAYIATWTNPGEKPDSEVLEAAETVTELADEKLDRLNVQSRDENDNPTTETQTFREYLAEESGNTEARYFCGGAW